MKKQRSAESTIRTHQLESVPCVVIGLEIVPLISYTEQGSEWSSDTTTK